ncbi:MAG: hypothetical protein ABSD46_14365 [Bacteroidota bacterium]
MKTKDATTIALRVLGIYCLIEAFVVLQGLVYIFTMPEEFSSNRSEMIIISLLPSIMLLFLGVLLIVFSIKLASLITPTSKDEPTDSVWMLKDIQPILFSVAGVLIFASAIPRTFSWISQLVALIKNDSHGLPYNSKVIRDSWVSLILSSLQMLLGIGLFFGSDKLSLFWQHLRDWSPNKEIDKRA